MSKFELNLALFGIVMLMGLGIASAVVTPAQPTCAVTKYAVPGDTFSLAGPTPPTGVAYTYLWTVADANSNQLLTAATQNTQYQIPTTSPTSYYVATLSVGSGTATSGQITGCVLQSCLLINVQLTNTCGISGANSVCQTDAAEVYTYTGNAIISGDQKTAYLNWIVDTTSVATRDTTGKVTVDWTKFWSTSGSGAQTHNVIAEVHSLKSNALLSTCTPYAVTVLPSPVTTITPS
jgi:hypothetical protein